MPTTPQERAALVALLRERPGKMKYPDVLREVLKAGSAVEVWDEHVPTELFPEPGSVDQIELAQADLQAWEAEGLQVVTVLDDDYPARLAGVHEAPPLLFARGDLRGHDDAVSVVGSRKATSQGIDIADGVARGLVAEGLTVLSGLAEGIDTAAHTAALDVGGRTVAIIGTGIRKNFPAANKALQERIARDGLLLSQFWPDAPPARFRFPMRNATMSGYGLATVVVQAGETSGARIQARVAVEHGRPVILTDLVVRANEWARALEGRPRVFVASSHDEVIAHVRDIRDQDRAFEQLIGRFATA